MQRADEIPVMITIHSSGGGRAEGRRRGGSTEGVKVRKEGHGEEGWGEKERGHKLFIPVGDNNDVITQLFCLHLSEVTYC